MTRPMPAGWPACDSCGCAPAALAVEKTRETGRQHVYRFCSVSCRDAARSRLYEIVPLRASESDAGRVCDGDH